jgi:hypothetical protein
MTTGSDRVFMEIPDSTVINALLDLWHDVKRNARVVIAVDVSGSMNEQHKIRYDSYDVRQRRGARLGRRQWKHSHDLSAVASFRQCVIRE